LAHRLPLSSSRLHTANCLLFVTPTPTSSAMSDTFLFTSESVNEGHPGQQPQRRRHSAPTPTPRNERWPIGAHCESPRTPIPCIRLTIALRHHRMCTYRRCSDKICDQVSDAVLDACLKDDPNSKVACETCTKTGMVMVFGEITTKSKVNYEQVRNDDDTTDAAWTTTTTDRHARTPAERHGTVGSSSLAHACLFPLR
jgi:hypothetical protein